MHDPESVVEMRGITVEFPGVRALDAVDLTLRRGEVHALMGENGAGKSTLIKALTGVYTPTAGSVVVDGAAVAFSGPGDAQAGGVSTVYQEVNLCPNLTVAENIMLGHEPRRFGSIDVRTMRRTAAELLARLDVHVDPASSLGTHSLAVQQLVAICRALVVDCKVLVLDEPTSSLDAGEVERLFEVMRRLRDDGVAILFVSHFLEQVYEISDRMTILRNGRLVGEYTTAELPRRDLVHHMIGASFEELERLGDAPKRADVVLAQDPLLQAVGLGRKGSIRPFDLDVHAGEVVGLAGLLGSGRTELARLLTGVDRPDTGQVLVDGRPARMTTPRASLRRKIAYSSEDRKAEGLVGDLTVRENIVLARQADRGWLRRLPDRTVDEIVDRYIKALDIRPANPAAVVRNLSGGNQQKVLLARWLATAPRLLVLDEPTRGIDVGAKAEIQRLVAELAADGMGVVFVSAELEEVLRLSHRVAVLRDRVKVGELVNSDDVRLGDVVDLIASGEAS